MSDRGSISPDDPDRSRLSESEWDRESDRATAYLSVLTDAMVAAHFHASVNELYRKAFANTNERQREAQLEAISHAEAETSELNDWEPDKLRLFYRAYYSSLDPTLWPRTPSDSDDPHRN